MRDPHNLVAHTVQGHRGLEAQQKRRRRCKVGHAIQPPYIGSRRTWVWYHRWDDHKGGMTDGARCQNCGKTLREIMILVKPELPLGGSAHLERALASTR